VARTPAAAALRYGRFRRVLVAGFLAHSGNWMQNTGRAYLVYDITGSTAALGTVFFFTYVPQLLFSLFGGVLADRYDRRRLLLGVQSGLLLSALLMGALAHSGAATLGNVAALSFVTGVLLAAQMPVSNALVPALVPRADLAAAVSMNAAASSAARIVGPLLVGVVVPLWGVAWLFWLNALSMPLLLWTWWRTPVTVRPTSDAPAPLAAVAAGVRYVRDTPPLAVCIAVVAVLSGVGLVYQPLTVVYATEVLAAGDDDRGATLFGVLQAALGAGSVLGVLGLANVARARPGGVLLGTSVGFSVALAGFASTSSTAVAVVAAVGVGAFQFANAALTLTVLQHETPEELRGRVLGLHNLAWVGLFPVSSVVGGQVADAVGVQATITGAAVVCLAFSGLVARWRHHLRAEVEPAGEVLLPVPAPGEDT